MSYLHERKVPPSKGNWGRVRSRYMKHLVSLWKELTPAEKFPYVDAARIDKERFLTEKENYESLHQAEEEISHKRRTDNNSKKEAF